jgi:ribonuclease P protein component
LLVLPKRYRLTNSADFQRVHAQGRCWSHHLLVLCKRPNGLQATRFGFSVSRRIGNAVVRNRTKRHLREALRPVCDLMPPGWDIVIIARAGLLSADQASIEDALTGLLGLARLLSQACPVG